MHFKLAPVSFLCFTLGLSSCIQMEQKAIVNPDGSGTFTVEQKMNISALKGMMGGLGLPGKSAGADQKSDPAEDAKQARSSLVKLLASARGVDVWTDASTHTDADGKSVTKVSGFCKDITLLSVSGGDSNGPKMDGMDSMMSVQKSTDTAGNLVLEVPLEKLFMEKSKKENKEGNAPKTPAERKAKRLQETQQMEMVMGMMGAMMKDAKLTFYYNFGQGEVLEHGAFKLVNPNTVSLEFKPMDMITAMGKIMKDEKLGEIIDASAEFDPKNPEHKKIVTALAESIYGGVPRVVVKPKGNAINYAEASAKAKAAQSGELKALLKEAEEAAKSAAENPFGRSLK